MPYKDKTKKRIYQLEYWHQHREKYFSDKSCSWCGSKDKLVSHHLDPSKKESHRFWSWSKERREKELKKCIVVCDTCHRAYHNEILRKPLLHGTTTSYRKGCRCAMCRNAVAIYNRKYLARRKSVLAIA